MRKKLSILLALNMLLTLLPWLQISAGALSSNNYTLTGNDIDDVIQVAVAQNKKTWNDLGKEMTAASNGTSYRGNWCGNFIWWCGYKAGLVSKGLYPSDNYFATAINPALWFAKSGNGKIYVYQNFYDQLLGRTEEGWRDFADSGVLEAVDKSFAPQKGDIIIYGKPQPGKTRVTITHAGYIRQNSANGKIYTVEGNTGSGVKLRDITADYYESSYLGYPIAYVRPNYQSAIPNGVYTLAPQCAPNARLDVKDGSTQKAANIQIYKKNDTEAQQFKFTYLGNEYYSITAQVSGKALDVQDGKGTSGANVQQYDPNATDAQKWKLEDAGNGCYYVIPKLNPALCLDVDGGGTSSGSNVQIWTKNQTDAQKWKISPVGTAASSTSSTSASAAASSKPTNFSISTDKSSYRPGETVSISPSARGATHYAISIWYGAFKTGERQYVNYSLSGGITFTPSKPGTYTIRADAKNSAGYISAEKAFTVTEDGGSQTSSGTSAADPCANGHHWNLGEITAKATVMSKGKKTYTCTVCGAVRRESVPAVENTYISLDEDDSQTIIIDRTGRLTLRGTGALTAVLENFRRDSFSMKDYKYFVTAITVEEGFKNLEGLIGGFPNVTSISLPDSLFFLQTSVFRDCTSLRSITIPSSVEYLSSNGIFQGCTALENIYVDGGNNKYISSNGVLFNKSMTALLAFPYGRSGDYSIPNGVTFVGENAFSWAGSLNSVTVPGSVSGIADTAFRNTNTGGTFRGQLRVYSGSYAENYAREHNLDYQILS